MSLQPSARWIVYALAGVLTLAAVVWVSESSDDSTSVVQPAARGAVTASTPAAPAARLGNTRPPSSALALPLPRQPQDPTANPFAVVGAAPEPGSVPVAPQAVRTVRQAPSAPALPFIYLGSWKERGKTSMFVQREDRAYKVDGPGPLDAEYAVQSVDQNSITFTYLPLGIVQELRLDAPSAAAPAVATAPARGGTPEPEQAEN